MSAATDAVAPLFLANWKMHMLLGETKAFAGQFLSTFSLPATGVSDTGIAASFTSLATLRNCFSSASGVLVGAQNVHWLNTGAHTGEISPPMLKELGVDFALCGHSERRQFYGESSDAVARRAKAAIEAGMRAVVCIGETREDFEAGHTAQVIASMLESSTAGLGSEHLTGLVIAYEPIWAIGTGLAATPEIASNVHDQIRQALIAEFGAEANSTPILYGGSIKPENIGELISMPNINGGLIGGASLDPAGFNEIISRGRTHNA